MHIGRYPTCLCFRQIRIMRHKGQEGYSKDQTFVPRNSDNKAHCTSSSFSRDSNGWRKRSSTPMRKCPYRNKMPTHQSFPHSKFRTPPCEILYSGKSSASFREKINFPTRVFLDWTCYRQWFDQSLCLTWKPEKSCRSFAKIAPCHHPISDR